MSAAPLDVERGPRRLIDEPRIITPEEAARVWARVVALAGPRPVYGGLLGSWTGEVRWARNRVSLASDRRSVMVVIHLMVNGQASSVLTNQLDDASLEAAIRSAERRGLVFGLRESRDFLQPEPAIERPHPDVFSESTAGLTTAMRRDVVRGAIDPAEAADMLSAGYLEVRAQGGAMFSLAGVQDDVAVTQGQCSITVRDGAGSASGWAGLSGSDWNAIEPATLAARALRKAVESRDPQALEPGRYTVILEPQAVHDLVSIVVDMLGKRSAAEQGGGPFTLGHDDALGLFRSKLGVRVVDERITLSHDPMDPLLGVVPSNPWRPVTWIERGVLTALGDELRQYALSTRGENVPRLQSRAFRMSGGETTLEQMIASTRRGLVVTRFGNVRLLDATSLLSTGLTRDGLWLVENGRITRPVKNFRFTESPLFALNSIEQLGPPVPVFRPWNEPLDPAITPAIVPPLKVRDFSFTASIDAI